MPKKNTRNEYAIIGLGHFGSTLALRLEALGQPVLGIDIDPYRVKDISSLLTETLVLNALDINALMEADITSFNTVVVAISRDFETSALITASLKELGIAHIICQSGSKRHKEILLRVGAERVIIPSEEAGNQLADELSIPGMLQRLVLSPEYSLIEILVPPRLVSKSVKECEKFSITVMAVLRENELILNPEPGFSLNRQDILVIIGEKESLAEFSSLI
jgi:trk system potassium uptake protein